MNVSSLHIVSVNMKMGNPPHAFTHTVCMSGMDGRYIYSEALAVPSNASNST